MAIQKNVIAAQNNGLPVYFDLYTPKTGAQWPVIVFLHGTRGFKEWGAWPSMGQWFAGKGFAFLAINFSHNGTSIENPDQFCKLEAYENNTISLELADVKSVLDWIFSEGRNIGLNVDDITLIGHSRGGSEAIILGVLDERPTRIVALAPPSDILKSYKNHDRTSWQKTGYISQFNERTQQEMRVGYQFVEDIENNEPDYNPVQAAALLGKPLLLIHGENDESVPVSDSVLIYDNCLHALFIRIPNTGHTFGTKHPMNLSLALPQPFVEMMDNVLEFIQS